MINYEKRELKTENGGNHTMRNCRAKLCGAIYSVVLLQRWNSCMPLACKFMFYMSHALSNPMVMRPEEAEWVVALCILCDR